MRNGRMDRFVSAIVSHKLMILIVVLACAAVVSFGVTRMKSEVILQDLFPYDHPYLKLQARFAEVFGGGGSGVAMAVRVKHGDIFNRKTLGKIKSITEEIELWDEVYRVLTVSMASNSVKVVRTRAKGEIQIEPLMFPEVPKDDAGLETLKTNIFSNPSYSGMLVSNDGSAAIILTEMKENIPYQRIYKRLEDLVTGYSDENTSIHIVGFPVLMGRIYSYKPQMYAVFGLSIACMILILFLAFRNLVGMIAPIAMSVICTGLGLGFIGWSGVNFSPLLYVLAFLVGARMVSNAVQITHRYIEEYVRTGDKTEAVYLTTRVMWMPNIMAAVTEVAGFLVLGIAKIVLMQQLAVIMGFWMATIALEGLLVPIICSYLPLNREKIKVREPGHGPIARVSSAMGRFSMGAGRYAVFIVIAVVVVVGLWQTTKLKVGDPTPGSPVLWEHDTYNKDQAIINKEFNASSENLVLYYEGEPESVYDPIVMRTFEQFAMHIAETLPDIYKTSTSIIDAGKILSVTLHDGDQVFYQLPRDEERMTGLLGYVRNTLGSANLRRYLDSTLERSQITLYFSDHTSDNLNRIRNEAYGFFHDRPMKTPRGQFRLAGGRIGMEMALNEEMREAHARIDIMVLIAIFIMCSLAFRSFIAGLMLTAPLILSNLIAFSYMSFMNIGLSVNTLPCSAVGVGVGVDFAIYLYSRCIEEFPRQKDYRDYDHAGHAHDRGGDTLHGHHAHPPHHRLVLYLGTQISGGDGVFPFHAASFQYGRVLDDPSLDAPCVQAAVREKKRCPETGGSGRGSMIIGSGNAISEREFHGDLPRAIAEKGGGNEKKALFG